MLYLHELVLGASAAGSLREDGGIWRLRGSAAIPPRLVELVELRLDALDSDARAALDVLAVAERIDLDQVSKLVDIETLERLEDEGLVEVIEEGGAPAHRPRPSRVWRGGAGQNAGTAPAAGLRHARRRGGGGRHAPARRRRPGRHLAARRWTAGRRRPAQHGRPPRVQGERLRPRRPAGEGGSSSRFGRAGRAGARPLGNEGRPPRGSGGPPGRARHRGDAPTRIGPTSPKAGWLVLGLYLGRARDALAVLDETIAVVPDAELIDQVRASVANILARAPRPLEAIEAARPLLDRPDSPLFWRAARAASIAMSVCGRLEDAIAVGQQGYDAHVPSRHQRPDSCPKRSSSVRCAPSSAPEDHTKPPSWPPRATTPRSPPGTATFKQPFAMHAGRICVHQGRLATAGRHFREAAAIYREFNDLAVIALDARRRRPRCRHAVGTHRERGRRRRARRARPVTETDARARPRQRGRAWTAAARRARRASAVAVLRAAAARAAETDQLVAEAFLRHDVARLGDARAEQRRLAELAEHIDGDLVPALAEHARALASGAAAPLEAAANRLAELGAALVAHEAATDAAAAWRADGHRRRAAACDELARRLAAECEGARSPAARADTGLRRA